MYRLIEYGSMLRDRPRVDAYRQALAAVITPSSIVLDLGTGIGTFSLLACRAGAKRVYAVESADVISVAEAHAHANGLSDHVHFLHARASELDLPERVDVIVSDLAGALPLFEEHLTAVMSVRDRFLAPGGVLIPQRDRLLCAPISNAALYESIVGPWRSLDLDLQAGETMALHTPQAHVIELSDLVAETRCWAELDYATIDSPSVRGSVDWVMDRDCVVHGFALWFETTLCDGITYASGPRTDSDSQPSVHATMVLPLLQPLELRRGQTLPLTLEAVLASGRYVTTWSTGSMQQSSFYSSPRSEASIQDIVHTPAETHSKVDERSEPAARERRTRRPARVLCQKVGSDLLLFDPGSGLYHVLNETGAHIWDSLERGEELAAIAAAVSDRYDVDLQQAMEDVTMILRELVRESLLEEF